MTDIWSAFDSWYHVFTTLDCSRINAKSDVFWNLHYRESLILEKTAIQSDSFSQVGWGSIETNPIVVKTLHLIRDRRFIPQDDPLRSLKNSTIARYVSIQWAFFAATIAVSETIGEISHSSLKIDCWFHLKSSWNCVPSGYHLFDSASSLSSSKLVYWGRNRNPWFEYGRHRCLPRITRWPFAKSVRQRWSQ